MSRHFSLWPEIQLHGRTRWKAGLRLGLAVVLAVGGWLLAGSVQAATNAVRITAMAHSGNSVTLRWVTTNAAGPMQYDVQMRAGANGTWQNVVTNLTTNMATFPAPVANGMVIFRIHCVNNGAEIPDTTPPTSPSGLAAQIQSCTQMALGWNSATDIGGSGIRGYQLYTNGRFYREIFHPATSFVISNLTPSAANTFFVRAVDAAGVQSPTGDSIRITNVSCDTLPPTKPAGLRVTSLASSQISLSWEPSSGQTGNVVRSYQVYRNGNLLPGVRRTTFTDTGLTPETSYCYTVAAMDNLSRASANSDPACATTVACYLVSPVSTELAANNSNGSFNVAASNGCAWSATSSASWIALVGNTAGAGNGTVIYSVSANTSGLSRSGAVTVGNQTFTITQSGTAPPPVGSGTAPQFTGTLPGMGNTHDVEVRGNFAYVANDLWGLSVVSVSNSAAPVMLGFAGVPFDGIYLTVSNSTACVTGTRLLFKNGAQSRVSVCYFFDVSNPTQPRWLGGLEDNLQNFYAPAISGNYAYVAAGAAGLLIFDISVRSSPVLVATFDTPGWAWGVAVSGGYAYVADGSQGVTVLNVSDPRTPAWVSAVDTAGNALHVAVNGNFAYVADNSAFTILDVSNRTAPLTRGRYLMGPSQSARQVKLQGGLACVALGSGGMLTLDISDPNAPTKKGAVLPSGGPTAQTLAVAIQGTNAYLANYGGGLAAVGAADTTVPYQTAFLMEWFAAKKVASKPGLAVISGTKYSENGTKSVVSLRFVDTRNATNPIVIGAIENNAFNFLDVAISGNYAYVAAGLAGLLVVDVSVPSAPVIVATNDTPGWATSVTVSDTTAYVADGRQGLRLLDIQNPRAPVALGAVITPGNALHVALEGNFAYVADNSSIQAIDVTDKSTPVIRGAYPMSTPQSAMQVRVQNGVAYVAAAGGGLLTLDVNDPTRIVKLGAAAPSGGPNASTQSVAINGTRVYAANYDGGLGFINTQNPSSPLQTATVLGIANILAAVFDPASGCVLAADSMSGLILVQP